MRFRAFKYLSPLLVYAGSFYSFMATGWTIWLPLAYAWIIIPALELFIRPDPRNMNATEEELARSDRAYDYLLYITALDIPHFITSKPIIHGNCIWCSHDRGGFSGV